MTNDGIEYLRTYLHLPPEIVPSTLRRQGRTETARPRAAVTRSDISKPSEDRAGYRRTPGGAGADKKADVGAGTADLEFVCSNLFLYRQNNDYFMFSERRIWQRKECTTINYCSVIYLYM